MVSQHLTRTPRLGNTHGAALHALTLTALFSLGLTTARVASAQAASPLAQLVPSPVVAPRVTTVASAAKSPNYIFLNSDAPAAADQEEENEKPSNDASHVGIKMHGHWVIDVKNPNGTVVDHRDFHNSIQSGGQEYLIALMAGYVVPSDYGIALSPGICPLSGTVTSNACLIVRSLSTYPGQSCGILFYCATGLTYNYNFPDSGGASMVLAGSITAPQAGTISYVETVSAFCQNNPSTSAFPPSTSATVSPASCTANPSSELPGSLPMSFTYLPSTPISVLAGQIVQVTVTISFS